MKERDERKKKYGGRRWRIEGRKRKEEDRGGTRQQERRSIEEKE